MDAAKTSHRYKDVQCNFNCNYVLLPFINVQGGQENYKSSDHN